MATLREWKKAFENGQFDKKIQALYGNLSDGQRERYIDALDQFKAFYGDRDNIIIVTAPGRTEIGGNHTDHNHGKVLTGAVNLDVLAIVSAHEQPLIRIQSKGHAENRVDLGDLSIQQNEYGHSTALIRGIASRLQSLCHNIGGFVAYTTSDVTSGSGLSSSAAFEVLVGSIFNTLYNGNAIDSKTLARTGQYAENEYFGKPCGLLDQMGSVCGGIVAIDFKDTQSPIVEQINFDLAAANYAMCITMAGGSHAELTGHYTAIPTEMKSVAAALGKSVLREVSPCDFYANIAAVRKQCGDRAVLRAIHFFADNERVDGQVDALKSGNFDKFLALINESGYSSYMYLQNVSTYADSADQEVALALALSESLLQGRGASRVHGGGFAGTIQAFVPNDLVDSYITGMDALLGAGSCKALAIRGVGPVVWRL
ncbi:MAG: galactokinase [Oscillospiraceae bacterium]|nr:galactokinase [Oscillospiraceae bacterium]